MSTQISQSAPNVHNQQRDYSNLILLLAPSLSSQPPGSVVGINELHFSSILPSLNQNREASMRHCCGGRLVTSLISAHVLIETFNSGTSLLPCVRPLRTQQWRERNLREELSHRQRSLVGEMAPAELFFICQLGWYPGSVT